MQHKYEHIHEPIDVKVVSQHGKLKVEEFYWNKQRYVIKQNCLTTKAMRGRSPVWMFAVATDFGSYQLRLDTETLHWWLEEIYTEAN